MPKSTKSFLVDINVWLAISYDLHVHHERASGWFETVAADQAFFCRLTQLGFLRLLTNSKLMGVDVLSQSKAWQVYDNLARDARVRFLREPEGVDATLRRLTRGSHPATNVWSDAYLAAMADASGLAIVTMDRAFQRFAGVDSIFV